MPSLKLRESAQFGTEPYPAMEYPLAELVPVHRLCLRMARDKDLDPDYPRDLTGSVTLDHAHQD